MALMGTKMVCDGATARQLFDAVMTNPATGETFRGSQSKVREQFAESCIRSGLTDSRSKIEWEN